MPFPYPFTIRILRLVRRQDTCTLHPVIVPVPINKIADARLDRG